MTPAVWFPPLTTTSDHDDWWACACTKRRRGALVAIKLHPPSSRACTRCGRTRPASALDLPPAPRTDRV